MTAVSKGKGFAVRRAGAGRAASTVRLLLGVTGMAYSMGATAVWAVAGVAMVEAAQFLQCPGEAMK